MNDVSRFECVACVLQDTLSQNQATANGWDCVDGFDLCPDCLVMWQNFDGTWASFVASGAAL